MPTSSSGGPTRSARASVQSGESRESDERRRSRTRISRGRVVRPILTRQVPLTVLRYAGEILSLPGVRLPSLLDPGPLAGNLARWIDWGALRRNIDSRRLDA